MNNKVELIAIHGSDLEIAQNAWTSTLTQLESRTDEQAYDLVRMLWRDGHTVPFEHNNLVKFHLVVDNATHIQLLRHRIASFSVESARYKEYTEDKYYLPEDWPPEMLDHLTDVAVNSFKNYHYAVQILEESGLSRKRAKETARFLLPMCIQIEMIMTMNIHAFLKFLKLRLSDHAQVEIRDVAAQMLEQVQETERFQHTIKAAGY